MATPYSLPERPISIATSEGLRLQPQLFDMRVASVLVTGTPTSDNSVFHFRLSLINGPPGDRDRETIRLDMSPGHTDPDHPGRGVLLVEYLASGVPHAARDSVPFSVAVRSGVRVRDMCNHLLNDLKVDMYDFSSEGGGCRHWCATALEHLAAAGFIDSKVGQLFNEYEEREGAKDNKGGPNFILPRRRGTFYV